MTAMAVQIFCAVFGSDNSSKISPISVAHSLALLTRLGINLVIWVSLSVGLSVMVCLTESQPDKTTAHNKILVGYILCIWSTSQNIYTRNTKDSGADDAQKGIL